MRSVRKHRRIPLSRRFFLPAATFAVHPFFEPAKLGKVGISPQPLCPTCNNLKFGCFQFSTCNPALQSHKRNAHFAGGCTGVAGPFVHICDIYNTFKSKSKAVIKPARRETAWRFEGHSKLPLTRFQLIANDRSP